MIALRVVNGAAGGAMAAAGALVGRPEVFVVAMPAGLVLFVVGAGSLAADAIPFRGVPFTCSALTMACGLAGLVRGPGPLVVGLTALALQVTPAVLERRRARPTAHPATG
jgi:hypothetical protein